MVPVIAPLAVVLAGGAVAGLHAPGPTQMRRHGWRFGPALTGLLLTIVISTAISGQGAESLLTFGGSFNGDAHLNYVAAVLVGLLWGALGGHLGAMVALALPGPLIARVRGRVTRARARTTAGATDGTAGCYQPSAGHGTRPLLHPATSLAPTTWHQPPEASPPTAAPGVGYGTPGGSEHYGIHDTGHIPTVEGPPSDDFGSVGGQR